jgi:hypothetical protein
MDTLGLISVEDSLELVVEDEHKSATGSSDDVGEASLEESAWSLVLEDLPEAVHGTVVHGVSSGLTSVHHESSSHGIERVRDNTGTNGDDLGETPLVEDTGLLEVLEENNFSSVEGSEVGGSVGDDTNNGDSETIVDTTDSTLLDGLLEAVNESRELSLSSGSDVSSESGSSEVQWVDEAEGGSTSSTTGGHVTHEEHAWLSLGVVWAQVLLVEVLASKVDGLGWEITNHVGEVTSPEGSETLLGNNSLEAVSNTVVSVLWGNVLVGILDLKQKLDSLNWGDDGLGDGGGNTTDQEIGQEGFLLWLNFISAHLSLIYLLYSYNSD